MSTRRCALASLILAGVLSGCGRSDAPSGAGGRVYITSEGSGDMSVIDPVRQEVIATVSLGKRPRGMVASPDGNLIYVALSGSPYSPPGVDESTLPPPDKNADGIGVFDTRQNKVTRFIPGGSNPEQLAVSADGRTIYIANKDASSVSLIDLASGKTVTTVPVGEEPEGVTSSPDGRFVYVTTEDEGKVTQIDTVTSKAIKQIKACNRPRTLIVSRDSARAVVGCEADGNLLVLDAVRLEPLETIRLGKQFLPMGMVLTRDGKTLYVATGRAGKAIAIDVATNKIRGSFATGGTRPWGIALSPDEKFVYTANGPSNDVSVVDVATQAVVKKIKTGDRPWGALTVAPR
jgi:YVTN family beta-propeller protein